MSTVTSRANRSIAKLIAALLVIGMVAAGCGDAKESTDGGGGGNDGESNTKTIDDSDLEIQRGGTLHFGIGAQTDNFCPYTAQWAAEGLQVATAPYEGLVQYDANHEVVGLLAESFEANADATEWTFKLRDGIQFQNGEPLDAAAVALNFAAFRGGDIAAAAGLPKATTIALWPLILAPIKDVTAPDASTVVVSMNLGWTAFPATLASGRFVLAAPEQLKLPESGDGKTCSNTLIGTGPFKPESNPIDLKSSTHSFVRSDNYWRDGEDGEKLPYLDGITFEVVETSSTRIERLNASKNYFDVASTNSSPDIVAMEDQAENGELQVKVDGDDFAEISYVMMNVGKAPLNDIRAREALVSAIDRETLNQIINFGRNTLTDQPFGPGVMGHVDGDVGFPPYDPERAKELVAELGGSLELNFIYATSPSTKQIVDQMQLDLQKIPGIKVNVSNMLQAELIRTALSGQDWDAMMWRNHPGSDPDAQYVWWHSGMPTNFGKIADDVIDKSLDEARSSTDPATREALYQDISKQFASQAYNGWAWLSLWGFGMRTNVHGLDPTTPDGDPAVGYWAGFTPVGELWIEQN